MRALTQFDTSNANELSRQLSQLESNVIEEVSAIRRIGAPVALVAAYAFRAAPAVVAALIDQQLSLDTTLGTVAVTLPALDPKNFGRRVTLVKRLAVNSVTVTCVDGKTTINGSPSLTLSAVGVTQFFCDSTGYYK